VKSSGLLFGAAVVALLSVPAKADLINSTINANISFSGEDSDAQNNTIFWTLPIFSGPISVGPGYTNSWTFSRQGMAMGFQTPSNVFDGTLTLTITGNTISINYSGQTQVDWLTATFTGLPSITNASEADSGFMSGVNMANAPSFTSTTLTISNFYLGYQPGTNTTQTDTLTFGSGGSGPPPAVPEPLTLSLMAFGLTGLGLMRRRRQKA